MRETDPRVLRPPFLTVPHRFVQFEAPGGREYWLFILGTKGPGFAARYLPVMQDDRPVVRVETLCEFPARDCAAITRKIMKGLPFAKRRR